MTEDVVENKDDNLENTEVSIERKDVIIEHEDAKNEIKEEDNQLKTGKRDGERVESEYCHKLYAKRILRSHINLYCLQRR